MTKKVPGFWAQLAEALAPKANRVVAAVAFVRTFRQGLNGSAITAAGGGVTLTALGIAEINWQTLGLALVAVGLTSFFAASTAWANVLQNGLSKGYTEGVVRSIEATRADSMDDRLRSAVVGAAAVINRDMGSGVGSSGS